MRLALALLFLLQDLDSISGDLKSSVAAHDAAKVKTALDVLVKIDDPKALDIALAAGGWAIKAQQELEKGYRDVQEKIRKAMEDLEKATDPMSRTGARDALTAVKTEFQAVAKKVSDAADIREQIARSLSGFTGDKAFKALVNRFASSSDAPTRALAAAALGRTDRPGLVDLLLEQLKKERDAIVQVAVLDALRAKRAATKEVLDALLLHVKSDLSAVQSAALGAIRALKLRDAIEPLIDAMKKADGRFKADLEEALISLTGVDKGVLPDAWRAWFDQNREAVLQGKYVPRADEKPAGRAGVTTFFGIPIRSKRVVFVLDCSKSMLKKADFTIEIETGPGVPPDLRPAGDRKIDAARYQIKKVLWQMPEDTRFDIVCFNRSFEVFRPELVKLTQENRQAAFEFVDRTELKLATNVFDSLERAIEFAYGPDGKLKRDGADTIYLLTDGLPNFGKFTTPADIEREIRLLNAAPKMTIHAVYVPEADRPGLSRPESFLRTLASDSGGIMVALRKK